MKPSPKKATGIHGEQLAEEYLITHGHKILDRNWRFSKSEIDLISMDGQVLVFTEVKTRSYDYFGKPESFVSDHKELLMHEAASIYMEKINHHWEFRFDIIGILLDAKVRRPS